MTSPPVSLHIDVTSCKSRIDSNRGCGMTSPHVSHVLTVIGGVNFGLSICDLHKMTSYHTPYYCQYVTYIR